MSNNNWQEEAMRRLRQMQQARGGVGGGGPQMPRAAGGALFGGLLLAGGALFLSNSLFNVDGGHRAIKYQRLTGVSKEIYNEGARKRTSEESAQTLTWANRNAHQHPLV
jgi:prohibitin 2